jgi:hypothetical protein
VAASVEMLGSWRKSNIVVSMASISAKRRKSSAFPPAPAHSRTAQLQARLFNDAMVATIGKLLDSGDESAVKTAMGLLSSAANHGRSTSFP